jgi:hypothetical protein
MGENIRVILGVNIITELYIYVLKYNHKSPQFTKLIYGN